MLKKIFEAALPLLTMIVIVIGGIFVCSLFGFAGFVFDLNFGLGSAAASTGPERLWRVLLAIGSMAGFVFCLWAARSAAHRISRYHRVADVVVATSTFAVAIALFLGCWKV